LPLREFGLVRLLQTRHDPLTFRLQFGGSGNGRVSDPPAVCSPTLFFLNQVDQAVFAFGHSNEHDRSEGGCRLRDAVQRLFSTRLKFRMNFQDQFDLVVCSQAIIRKLFQSCIGDFVGEVSSKGAYSGESYTAIVQACRSCIADRLLLAIAWYCRCAAVAHPASNTAAAATLRACLALPIINMRMKHSRFAPGEAARLPRDFDIIAEIQFFRAHVRASPLGAPATAGGTQWRPRRQAR